MSLLSDIAAYSERTGTPLGLIGRKALNDKTFCDGLRNGRSPRPETERRVRKFLADHPEGIAPKRGRPDAGRCGRVESAPDPSAVPVAVNRDPCPHCGVRGDIGCEHGRAGVNW